MCHVSRRGRAAVVARSLPGRFTGIPSAANAQLDSRGARPVLLSRWSERRATRGMEFLPGNCAGTMGGILRLLRVRHARARRSD